MTKWLCLFEINMKKLNVCIVCLEFHIIEWHYQCYTNLIWKGNIVFNKVEDNDLELDFNMKFLKKKKKTFRLQSFSFAINTNIARLGYNYSFQYIQDWALNSLLLWHLLNIIANSFLETNRTRRSCFSSDGSIS